VHDGRAHVFTVRRTPSDPAGTDVPVVRAGQATLRMRTTRTDPSTLTAAASV